jgi:MFS transporter, putative metabolite:H+ symporter
MGYERSAPGFAVSAGAIVARIDRLPATRTIWSYILLLSFGFFFELYDILFSGYVAPGLVKAGILKSSSGGANDFWSFLVTLFYSPAGFIASLFAGLFIGTIICGFLADRFGRRAIFTWSLLWYTVADIIVAFQDTTVGLNFWRFVSGLGLGLEIITIGAYLSELAPKNLRGRAFACCQAIGFCSTPVVAFLAYLLVPRAPLGFDGWRWIVLIGADAAIFIWFMRRALPESPRWLAQHGRLAEADKLLSEIEAKVEAEYGRPLPPPEPPESIAPSGRFADMWRPPLRARVIMLSVFNVFQTVGFYGFANWVPSLLIKQGITISTSLGYTSLIAIAAPFGPLLGFWIGDRVERKFIICTAAAAILICGLLFGATTDATIIIAMGVGLTLASNVMSYSFHAYQQELFPTGIRARAAGFVYSWSRLSVIFNSFVIAGILDAFGTPGVFVFIAAAMAVVIGTIALFGPRTTNLSLEQISR